MASFTITDLGTLGGTFSFARSLNNSGQVVGESQRADGIVHAFLWSTGIITDLGALAPGQSSFATAINDSGIITGYSGTSASTPPHAFLYGSGVMHDLGTLPGDIESEGYGVNSTSQVVGVSRTGSGTYLLIFNNGIYESTDASATSWTQEPLPSGGPHGVIALATGANVNGLVLDSGLGAPTLWRRLDRNTFVQIATGDYFPDFHDFYTFPPFVPGTGGGTTIVGNLGAPHGQPPTYAKSTDGGTVVQSLSFPASLQFLAGSTFVRFWADERTGANFLAQVRDPSGVDHLYASPDLQTWKPLALPTAPTVQAALLVAAALIGPVVAPTNWLPSQFNVGSQDNWLTAGAMYQEVINGSSLVMASRGSASITTTGGGNKQTTQFVCTKAIPGTDTAVTVFAVLFDSPGVTFAPGGAPSIVALGAGGADYTIPSAGTITQGGRSFLIAGQMANVFAPSPIPAGSVYQIQWTNKTPPGWTNATVLAMVLDVVGNYDILFGGLDNVSQGQNASPVTVDTGPTKPFVFTPPPPPYGMALQLMNVLTDGVPANLSVVGSNFTVPPGGPDPMGPQGAIKDVRSDFLRKQNGTYLVAVDLASGAPAIARSVDGVGWIFTTLPDTARPTPGLTECDDGTVLVPSDGTAGPGLIFRSIDDGQSFQAVLTPPGVTTANVYLKYFPGLNTLFAFVGKVAGTGTTVYLSTNQGQSWSPLFTSPQSAGLFGQTTSWMALTPAGYHTFLYSGGTMSQINIAGYHPVPTGINDLGRIVGYTSDPVDRNKRRAFLYSSGVTTDIGTLPGDTYSRALGINNNGDPGDIVGESFTLQTHRPFRYVGGAMTGLPLPTGQDTGIALGLNNFGEIVGSSGIGTSNRAFIVGGDVAIDLNTLIPVGSGFSVLTSAVGINDAGQIAGYGTITSGETHAFLLTPIEASTPSLDRARRCPTNADFLRYFVATVANTAYARSGLVDSQIAFANAIRQALLIMTFVYWSANCKSDPFDPNFMTVFSPVFHDLPQLQASPCLSQGLVTVVNRALHNGGLAISNLQAMNASLNRAQSAFTLGDMGSFQLQDGALGNFTDAVVDGLAKCQHGIEHLVSKLEGTPCDIAIARADVASFIDDVKVRGIAAFPQAELNVFALFNVDPSQAVDAIVNLDPSLVPILLSEGLRQDAAAIGRLAEVYGK